MGNAVWGGVWLRDLLAQAVPGAKAQHVSFEGLDKPLGSAGIKFIRSIPLEKALASTLLAYEMNGEPLPVKHGYPLRALALGWTGANCVKWVQKITLLARPFEGFFMDNVYRVFQKGEEARSGTVVTELKLKSIITQPLNHESLPPGPVTILGAAYAGEADVERLDVSLDDGATWHPATFIGPHAPYAWRQWQYVADPHPKGVLHRSGTRRRFPGTPPARACRLERAGIRQQRRAGARRDVSNRLRARAKITLHFRRRCIPPDCVAKTRNMLDIPAFSRLVSRAPQHLKLRTYFCANPKPPGPADARRVDRIPQGPPGGPLSPLRSDPMLPAAHLEAPALQQ